MGQPATDENRGAAPRTTTKVIHPPQTSAQSNSHGGMDSRMDTSPNQSRNRHIGWHVSTDTICDQPRGASNQYVDLDKIYTFLCVGNDQREKHTLGDIEISHGAGVASKSISVSGDWFHTWPFSISPPTLQQSQAGMLDPCGYEKLLRRLPKTTEYCRGWQKNSYRGAYVLERSEGGQKKETLLFVTTGQFMAYRIGERLHLVQERKETREKQKKKGDRTTPERASTGGPSWSQEMPSKYRRRA